MTSAVEVSMRERIARVLDADAWNKPLFNGANHQRQTAALAKADAVLAEMTEPTLAMIEAGAHAGPWTDNRYRAMIQTARSTP